MDGERCPSCHGPIFNDGPCLHCTSPLPGYHGPLQGALEMPSAPAVPPAFARVRMGVYVLVLGLGAYWIIAAALQLRGALSNGPGGGSFLLLIVAVLSLVVSAYTVYVAWMMSRRSYRIQGQLVLASAIGIGWGIFIPLLLGNWYQALVLPFHAAVAVLALAGSRFFETGR